MSDGTTGNEVEEVSGAELDLDGIIDTHTTETVESVDGDAATVETVEPTSEAADAQDAAALGDIINRHADRPVEATTEPVKPVPTFAENAVDAGGRLATLANQPDVQKAVVAGAAETTKVAKKEIPKAAQGWTLDHAKALRAEAVGEENTRMRILYVLWNRLDEAQQKEFLEGNTPFKVMLKKYLKMGALPGVGHAFELMDLMRNQIVTHLPIPTETLRAWFVDLDDFNPLEVQSLIAAGVLYCKGGETVAAEVTKRFVTLAGTAALGARAVSGIGKIAGVAGKATAQGEVMIVGKVLDKGGTVLAGGADMLTTHIEGLNAIRTEVQKIQPEPETIEEEVAEERDDLVKATKDVYPPVIDQNPPNTTEAAKQQ